MPKKKRHFQVSWCEPVDYEGLRLERSGTIVHHRRDQCGRGPCPFHDPSDHIMVDWDMILRESGLIERVCPHGIGHPDPDSVEFYKSEGQDGWGVHGCDGCCHDPLVGLRRRVDRLAEIADS